MPMAAGGVQAGGSSMTDIFPRSGGENKFVAEGFGNRASGFEQRFEMIFRGLLKTQSCFAPVPPVRVATGQQAGFRNPYAIFIPSNSHLCQRYDHLAKTLPRHPSDVKRTVDA